MTTPDPQHVFISYSTKDVHFVERLRASLDSVKITYWVDRESLRTGMSNWERAIRAAIKESTAVILVASPNVIDSDYVQAEIEIALMSGLGGRIYPVWAQGDDGKWADCVPMKLVKAQHVDMRGDHYDSGFTQLLKALQGKNPELAYTPPPVKPPAPGVVRRSPYKGLSAFQEADAGDFFGRAAAISELIAKTGERVNAERGRLLAVIGASGSGKSSVVMAGLLPRLKKGDALAGSESWLYAPPITPGSTPIRALTRGLSRALPEKSFGAIEDDLWRPNGLGLANLAYSVDQRVILFIDQFEEVFMPSVSPDERDQMINLLVQAANEPRGSLTMLLTLRADYYDRPMNYRELGELISRNQYSLLPMTLTELREAVENPALLPDTGLAFEPGLVGEIVFDLREAKDKMALAGALPLLQFTLQQLYDKRDTSQPVHVLTMSAYADLGGVSGAISQHAESVFAGLDEEAQGRLGRVFFRLINVDERGEPTRQRAQLGDFEGDEASMRLIDAFVGARLLLANRTEEAATLEVAHEALLRNWDQLVKWIAETAESKRLLQKLEVDATYWAKRGKPRDRYRYTHEQEREIEAIRALWQIKFDLLVEEFLQPQTDRWVEALRATEHFSLRQIAEDEIRSLGRAAVPGLLKGLSHNESSVRSGVARLLGQIGDKQAIEALIEAAADDVRDVRIQVAHALGELNDSRARNTLVNLLHDLDSQVRGSAAEALGIMSENDASYEALIETLDDSSAGVRYAVAGSLGQLLGRVTPPSPFSKSPTVHKRDDAIIALIIHADDPHSGVRYGIAEALGKAVNSEAVISRLIAMIGDSNDSVRIGAIEALGRRRDIRAFDPLVSLLSDDSSNIRLNSVNSLRRIGDRRAVEPIIGLLSDKSSDVVVAAIEALVALGDERAIEPLEHLMNTEQNWLGGNAKAAVAKLKAHIDEERNPSSVPDWLFTDSPDAEQTTSLEIPKWLKVDDPETQEGNEHDASDSRGDSD